MNSQEERDDAQNQNQSACAQNRRNLCSFGRTPSRSAGNAGVVLVISIGSLVYLGRLALIF